MILSVATHLLFSPITEYTEKNSNVKIGAILTFEPLFLTNALLKLKILRKA
jgi:hypothetical protein